MNGRKIIQICMAAAGGSSEPKLVALCDDGTLWMTAVSSLSSYGYQVMKHDWIQLTPPPKS